MKEVIASLKEVHERGDHSPRASRVSIEEDELSHPKDIFQLTHSPKRAIRALLSRPPSSYTSSASIDPLSKPLIIIGRLDNTDALLCAPHTYVTISSDRRGGNGSKVEVSASIGRVSDMMIHDAVGLGSSSTPSARQRRNSLLSYLPQSDAPSPVSHRDALGPRTDAPVRHRNRLPGFSSDELYLMTALHLHPGKNV